MKNRVFVCLLVSLLVVLAALPNGLILAQNPQSSESYEIKPQVAPAVRVEGNMTIRNQDNVPVIIVNPNSMLQGNTVEEKSVQFLNSHLNQLGFGISTKDTLLYTMTQNMESGAVVRFNQRYAGLQVDRNEVTLKFTPQGQIGIVLNTTVPVSENLSIQPVIGQDSALSAVRKHLGIPADDSLPYHKVELMVHVINLGPSLCWQVNCISWNPHGDWEGYVDAQTGEIIELQNIICAVTGYGKVFNPNPTYTAKTQYGIGGFVDNNDATNPELDAQMMNVELKDIEFADGMYKLKGPYAEVVSVGPDFHGLYEQDNPNFNFNRSNPAFEAVMCYYHIDKSMRYINNDLNVSVKPIEYEGGLRFDPHSNTATIPPTAFYSDGDYVAFTDGLVVDDAEDAFIILHEMGHAVHHFQTNEKHSRFEGLSEGLSDYWGASSTRDCADVATRDEWQPEYHQVFYWGSMPSAEWEPRTTNYTLPYSPLPPLPPHKFGQHISTALMRIHSDLGRYKTDKLVLEAMPLLRENIMVPLSLRLAGAFIYRTAVDLGFSNNDLCIIYKHLEDKLSISIVAQEAGITPPSGNTGDIYMKDTPCDNGTEVNPDTGPMWLSRDIWVRHDEDGGLEHQNPEYKEFSPNYVYVRVRGKGCASLSGATLRVYFSKASTGLQWPSKWDNYFTAGPNGLVLTGDEITSIPIEVPPIAPGDEVILSIPWYPPNPANFYTEKHHFCLLARVISPNDPMFIAEGADVALNTKNNNNIAWKNISIFDDDPNNIIEGPVSVFIGCEGQTLPGRLKITAAQNALNKPIQDYGMVYLRLREPLRSLWVANGSLGAGFAPQSDGSFRVTNNDFYLDGLPLDACENYVAEVSFEPAQPTFPCAFDLIQLNHQGIVVGGERFEYQPSPNMARGEVTQRSNVGMRQLNIYPNPADNQVNLAWPDDVPGQMSQVQVFDVLGVLIYQINLIGNGTEAIYTLDVSTYPPGVYEVTIKGEEGRNTLLARFVKQ